MTADELWRDVVGYQGYYRIRITTTGIEVVEGITRTITVRGKPRTIRAKTMKPNIRPTDGRRSYHLSRDGRAVTRHAKRLLREAGFTI